MSAKERILGRIRAALDGREARPHPGAAPTVGRDDDASAAERFALVLGASGGESVRLRTREDAARWVRDFSMAFASAAVGADVPASLRPPLPAAEPAHAGLAVSVAVAGAAATGTLVLASPEGRALQLLAPVHVVWIEARRIHAELAGALGAARGAGPLPAALGLHSGPSKSADIGRIVVTGVHGPGRLVAAIAAFPLGEA